MVEYMCHMHVIAFMQNQFGMLGSPDPPIFLARGWNVQTTLYHDSFSVASTTLFI